MNTATGQRRKSLTLADLPPGEMVGVTVGSVPVVVIRTAAGELRAFVDRCVHQGARVSRGRLHSHTDGEEVGEYRLVEGQSVVKCPWHGYEYDARSGCALFDPRRRLRKVSVDEFDGRIVVSVAAPST